MASLMKNQECCLQVENATNFTELANVIIEHPHLLISKDGVSVIVRSIPSILRRSAEKSWNFHFLQTIFDMYAKLRWDYDGTIGDSAKVRKDIGWDYSPRDWTIHILRAYLEAMIDQTEGKCLIQQDLFYTAEWEAIKNSVPYNVPETMLAWIPTLIRFDYKLNVHDPYRDKFIRYFLSNNCAMKQFFLVLADACIPMNNAFGTATVMATIARNNDVDEARLETMGYPISPFIEKCQDQDVGWLEGEVHKANIQAEEISRSELIANCQEIMVHMGNIVDNAFAAENYFFEIIGELSCFYPVYKAREDTSSQFERYFDEDAWNAMADITASMVECFGPLESYKPSRALELAERAAAIRLEGIIRNLRLTYPDVDPEVYKLFIRATIKCMGRGFRGAADGMLNHTDAIIETIFKEDQKTLESDMDFMDLMMAMEAEDLTRFNPGAGQKKDEGINDDFDELDPTKNGGDGGGDTAPTSNADKLALHNKSGASNHTVSRTATQSIANAYRSYKNMEGKVDNVLTGIVGKVKKMIEGDQNTILIEGKQFSVVGLLKKVVLTVGLFNFGKIKAILMLICGKKMQSKARKAERIKLIAELETELEIIEEKIRDASGDDNREAKYAMMRTRAALKEALTRLKYSTDAAKAASYVKNSYLGKTAHTALRGAANVANSAASKIGGSY